MLDSDADLLAEDLSRMPYLLDGAGGQRTSAIVRRKRGTNASVVSKRRKRSLNCDCSSPKVKVAGVRLGVEWAHLQCERKKEKSRATFSGRH